MACLIPATTFNASNRQRTDNNFDMTALSRYTPEDRWTSRQVTPERRIRRTSTSVTPGRQNTMAMEMVNFAGDGNYYTGNLGLKPEVANTFSATANWHDAAKERTGIAITPYVTYVQDYINVRRCPTTCLRHFRCRRCQHDGHEGICLSPICESIHQVIWRRRFRPLGTGENKQFRQLHRDRLIEPGRGENRTTADNLYNMMPVNARLAVVHSLGKWINYY